MLCFGTKEQMLALRNTSVEWLEQTLHLEINHCGEINRTAKGVPFLGHVLHPCGARLVQRSEHRFRSKFRKLEQQAERGRISEEELAERGQSLFASAAYGNTKELRRHLANTSRFRDA